MSADYLEKIANNLATQAVTHREAASVKQADSFFNTNTGRYALGGLGGAGLGALVGAMQPKKKKRNALYYGALGGLGGLGLAHLVNNAGTKSTPTPPASSSAATVPARVPKKEDAEPWSPAPLPDADEYAHIPAGMYKILPESLRSAAKQRSEVLPGGRMRDAWAFKKNSPEYVAANLLARPDPNDPSAYKLLSAPDVLPDYAKNFVPGKTQEFPYDTKWIPGRPHKFPGLPSTYDAYFQTGKIDPSVMFGTNQTAADAQLRERVIAAVRAAAAKNKDLPNFGFSLDNAKSTAGLYQLLRQQNVIPAAAGEPFAKNFNLNDPATIAMLNRLREQSLPSGGTAYDAAVRSGAITPQQLAAYMAQLNAAK